MAPRKPTGSFDLENSLSHLLRRAQQFAHEQFVQQMGTSSLTPRQFIVLFAVDEEEGLSQTDLVNRTGIDRSTLADMISRMIKNGLLARKRTAEDARANSVRLTAAGRRALKGAMPKALAAEQALLDVLSKGAQNDLMKALGQLNKAIESEKTEEEAPKAPVKRATRKPAAKKPATRRQKKS
jgi:DNA-binding MarR family transcriptional regulator